jgi:hypothetical protein
VSKPKFQRSSRIALLIGVLLSLVSVGIGLSDHIQFYRSYLLGFLIWFGAPLGALSLLTLFYLTGGRWGEALKPVLEALVGLTPWMALLFIPIVVGLANIFEWAEPSIVASNIKLFHKAAYLNRTAFTLRTLGYFVVWILLGQVFTGKNESRKKSLAGPALVVVVITVSLSSIDWIMSLEPDWYSTIFGLVILAEQGLVALCLSILTLALSSVPIERKTSNDLGGILLTFVMLWAYLSFIPEEVIWFKHRSQGGWQYLAIFFISFQVIAPFYMLLFRAVKNRIAVLAGVAALTLSAYLMNQYWIIAASFTKSHLELHFLDVAEWLAIGGIFMSVFLRNLRHALEVHHEA